MADVFISYKREEIAWAARVAQALMEEGYSAFYDLDDDGIHAGEEWDKRLETELAAASCCVVLWSAASAESANVRSEARRANGRGVLVPAKITVCEAPIGLDALQEADLRAWRGDRADPQWRFLVDRGVARKVGRAARGVEKAPSALRAPPPLGDPGGAGCVGVDCLAGMVPLARPQWSGGALAAVNTDRAGHGGGGAAAPVCAGAGTAAVNTSRARHGGGGAAAP